MKKTTAAAARIRAWKGSLPATGTILPPDDDFELVNKVARKGIWSDSEIRKVRGHTGTNHLHYAV